MAAGDPTGADLTSGTTNGNTLPEPWPPDPIEEREITFVSPIELISGTTYAIVVSAPDAADINNRVGWGLKTSNPYADGARYLSSDSGSSWSEQNNHDQWFQTKASGVVKDSGTFAETGSVSNVYGATWGAQTFLAGSTYTISSVVLTMLRAAGASPGTITVSIRAVAKTIDSVEFYIRDSGATGWDMIVNVREVASYTTNPSTGDILGSKSISVDSIPVGPGWVVFTFDTPIEISNSNFYGIELTHSATSKLQLTKVRIYQADDYDDATGGPPYDGKERSWYQPWLGSWGQSSIYKWAYRVNCTGVDDNEAESVTADYVPAYEGTAVRSYLDAAPALPALPGKPTNPAPGNTASDITLDESPLSWDASDPVADTYEIYFREQGDGWSLVGVAQAGVSWVIDFGTLNYDITYEWRVDATNVSGTTTGDTWNFGSIIFAPILPGASGGAGGGGGGGGSGEESSPNGENNMITLRRLVAVAANKFWYEDI